MGAIYISREGQITGADAFVSLTAFGGTTLNDATVPVGKTKIRQFAAAVGMSAVVASAGVTLACRLTGTAIKEGGQQDLTIGGAQEDTTSTAGLKFVYTPLQDVDIDIQAGNIITISGAQHGVDIGTVEMSVTLGLF